ncbi:MAG: hypothetical protein AB8H47_07750 [Bacteroidia bacterium]
MKKYILISLAAVFSLNLLWSQNHEIPPSKQEQFESIRIAFLTQKLSLSSEEAKVFWPVYDAYREELKQVYRRRRRIERRIQSELDEMTEIQMERLSNHYINLQKDEYEIRAKYHESFKEVLTPRKIILLYKAESDLNREILKRLRENRQNN